MADEYFIKEFEDYIEQLCIEHVDIKHKENGRVCFSRLRSQTEINQLVNNAGEDVVIMGRFNGRAVGDTTSQNMRQFSVLRFASYAKNDGVTDPAAAIDDAIERAQNIMFQFIARWRRDQKADDCGPLGMIELESVSWNEIDEQIYLENHYGWDLSVSFKEYFPSYDANKWTN